MKALLLILALVLTVQGQSVKEGKGITEWAPLFDVPNAQVYYSSIARNEDIVKVWFKIDFPNGSDAAGGDLKAGHNFGSIRGFAVLNCRTSTATTGPAFVLYYDRSGNLVRSVKEKESVSLAPVAAYFCEQGFDKKPLTAPQLKPQPNP